MYMYGKTLNILMCWSFVIFIVVLMSQSGLSRQTVTLHLSNGFRGVIKVRFCDFAGSCTSCNLPKIRRRVKKRVTTCELDTRYAIEEMKIYVVSQARGVRLVRLEIVDSNHKKKIDKNFHGTRLFLSRLRYLPRRFNPVLLRECGRNSKTGTWLYKDKDKGCVPCVCISSERCDDATGACKGDGCPEGFHGRTCSQKCVDGTYGKNCKFNCSEFCMNTTCAITTGYCSCSVGHTGERCDRICARGYYGRNCAEKCKECTSKTCNRYNGSCEPLGCNPGFKASKCDTRCGQDEWGQDCANECHCFGKYTCDHISGDCGEHGCSQNWKGPTCNESDDDCPENYYGRLCNIPCGGCSLDSSNMQNLVTGHCDRNGNCPLGCTKGYVGQKCDNCELTKYGHDCQRHCGHCLDEARCHSISGICINTVCGPGYMGSHCTYECSEGLWGNNCVFNCTGHCADGQSCNIVNGTCVACESGWSGPRCDQLEFCNVPGKWGNSCNRDCHHCRHGSVCTQHDGYCPLGCSEGYFGKRCDRPCRGGTYGEDCVYECGYCREWENCDRFTGECLQGCLGFFVPPFCSITKCPVGYSGIECTRPCGSCLNNKQCDVYSSACLDGCLEGFTGHYCDLRLTDLVDLDVTQLMEKLDELHRLRCAKISSANRMALSKLLLIFLSWQNCCYISG